MYKEIKRTEIICDVCENLVSSEEKIVGCSKGWLLDKETDVVVNTGITNFRIATACNVVCITVCNDCMEKSIRELQNTILNIVEEESREVATSSCSE